MWRPDAIAFDIVAEDADHPVATVGIATPHGIIYLMAAVELTPGGLILTGLHMHHEEALANAIGPANLRILADVALERLSLEDVIIEGAARTTWGGPGRRPGRIRLTTEKSSA